MQDFHSKQVERLYKAIALIKDENECGAFFEDICTITEICDMAQRLETAMLLSEGKSYQEVARKVGISTATISRVSRCLNYGSGGYKTLIERLKESETDDEI